MENYYSRILAYFKNRLEALDPKDGSNIEYGVLKGGRNWEKFYRARWGHDKIAPSTHGNNCSGSCRWHVYSKDGIIVWFDRTVDYFEKYSRQFTYFPYLLVLDKKDDSWLQGRFLRASDFNLGGGYPEWKSIVYDKNRNGVASPNGSMGTRYGDEGKWNLDMQDCYDEKPLDPVLSFADLDGVEWLLADFSLFAYNQAPRTRKGAVPVKYMEINGEKKAVTTVFDIFAASLGIDRGHGGDVVKNYNDAEAFYSPAWQETITGVDKAAAIRVAREFAENAEKTRGRSLNIIGGWIQSLVQ